ncbi:MAG: adenosylcobinamide-phosphate guanylyltransferase [Candidatus Nitrosomirales archaeon]|jgi:adenosylcobinamide-phosphate guanylyltransferase
MAGGMGKRMNSDEEKPMLNVNNKPMISYIVEALKNSNCFDKIIGLVSKNTARTAHFLANNNVQVAFTSGADYVKDLNYALELVRPNKVFIISSDLPLIDSNTIKKIVDCFDRCKKPCLTVVVRKSLVDELGISTDYSFEYDGNDVCHSGVSIIDSSKLSGYERIDEELLVMDTPQLALNVNTIHELELAEKMLTNRVS